jgi:large subunit ribosomal protein L40
MRDRYESMREALAELERSDERLFAIATEPEKFSTLKGSVEESLEGRLEGLFPRQLWVPTDTKGKDAWDSEWTRPLPEQEEAGK